MLALSDGIGSGKRAAGSRTPFTCWNFGGRLYGDIALKPLIPY